MKLKFVFIDAAAFSYHPGTPEEESLGGSQSAGIYLMRELVRRGHQVALANAAEKSSPSYGISHHATGDIYGLIQISDIVVLINNLHPTNLRVIRESFPDKIILLWMHHATNQEAAQFLSEPAVIADYSGMVFVSEWQRLQYIQDYPTTITRPLHVRRNAIAPSFEDLFKADEAILPQKSWPPALFYASTPFRGLDRLLGVYHQIAPEFPGLQLQVFSSLQIYREPNDPYQQLYYWVVEQPGGQYFGSVTQPALAQYLKAAMCLAYPNTFPETSCIAVMEAMAAGCLIMTSDLGALPETCAGLAKLEPYIADAETHVRQFSESCAAWLREIYAKNVSGELEAELRARVDYANAHYRWAMRAEEWEQMAQQYLHGEIQAGLCA